MNRIAREFPSICLCNVALQRCCHYPMKIDINRPDCYICACFWFSWSYGNFRNAFSRVRAIEMPTANAPPDRNSTHHWTAKSRWDRPSKFEYYRLNAVPAIATETGQSRRFDSARRTSLPTISVARKSSRCERTPLLGSNRCTGCAPVLMPDR